MALFPIYQFLTYERYILKDLYHIKKCTFHCIDIPRNIKKPDPLIVSKGNKNKANKPTEYDFFLDELKRTAISYSDNFTCICNELLIVNKYVFYVDVYFNKLRHAIEKVNACDCSETFMCCNKCTTYLSSNILETIIVYCAQFLKANIQISKRNKNYQNNINVCELAQQYKDFFKQILVFKNMSTHLLDNFCFEKTRTKYEPWNLVMVKDSLFDISELKFPHVRSCVLNKCIEIEFVKRCTCSFAFANIK